MNTILDAQQIAKILPQEYPFIMIDRVVEFEKDKSLTAIKNITGTEWIFEGQEGYQSNVFPETLLIEAAAQAAYLLFCMSKVKEGEIYPDFVLGRIDCTFQNSANIGQQVIIKSQAIRMLTELGQMNVSLKNEKGTIAEAKVFYSLKVIKK